MNDQTIIPQQSLTQIPQISLQQILDDYKTEITSLLSTDDKNRNHNKSFEKSHIQKIKNISSKLKNPLFSSILKPKMGSLDQFLTNGKNCKQNYVTKRDAISLSRKKVDRNSQNNLTINVLGNKSPQNILQSMQSNKIQRKAAVKQIIEKQFYKAFKQQPNAFHQNSNNNNQQIYSKLNLSILQTLLNKFPLKQQELQKKQENSEIIKIQKKYNKQLDYIQTNIDLNIKNNLINDLKNKYISLKAIKFQYQYQHYFNEQCKNIININYKNTDKNDLKQTNFWNNCNQLILQNHSNLKNTTMIHLIKYLPFQRLKIVKLHKIKMNEIILFLLLDCIRQLTIKNMLSQLHISCIAISGNLNMILDLQQFSKKISQLITKIQLKKLSLNYLDLSSEQCCLICIGIANNFTLQQVSFKDNCIDENALKSIETVARFCKSLKRIDVKGNNLAKSNRIRSNIKQIIIL